MLNWILDKNLIPTISPLDSKTSKNRTADTLDSYIWSKDNTCSQNEDVPAHNAMLMMKAKGLLNLVIPYLEEMEREFTGAGTGILAMITDEVS